MKIDGKEVRLNAPTTFKEMAGQGPSPLFAKVLYADPALREDRVVDTDQIEVHEDSSWKLKMLNEQILGDCELKLVGFEDQEAVQAFRHSSAHILGYAIEQTFDDPHLTIGPPIKDGFFYDFFSEKG